MGSNNSAILNETFFETFLKATVFFGVPVTRQNLDTATKLTEIPGWDSLNAIALTLALEKEYKLAKGTLHLNNEDTLADVSKKISALRSCL